MLWRNGYRRMRQEVSAVAPAVFSVTA